VLQEFFHWGVPLRSSGALHRWTATDTRGVLSLSTAPGSGGEVITPLQISKGWGDHYILRLNETIANSGQTVYVRLMPEMNGHWNPYSMYNANGTKRPGHGTRAFKRAWRRFALIIRGGVRRGINRKLRRQGMPRIHRAKFEKDPVYAERGVPRTLPRPRVALMWTPQTIGSPNLRGNRPRKYWPGARYVNWVGADIFSKYATPGIWAALNGFFKRKTWRRKPFVIGEYSPWDNDSRGAFVRSLFRWGEKRKRVKMLIYYRSVSTTNPHNVQFYPRAKRSLRRILNKPRYKEYAPGVRKIPDEPPPPK
jgi:hypothetical protein